MLNVQTIGGLLLCCVLPGCLLAEVVAGWRGRLGPFTRLMLGIGVSIVYAVLAGLALASFHRLTRSGALAALLVPTLLLAGILVAREGRRLASLRRAGITWQERLGRGATFLASLWSASPWRILVFFRQPRLVHMLHLLVLLAFVAGPRLYVASASSFVPLQPDSWFYMADSLRLVDTQGIPTEITQWGMHTAFPPDKISFQLFTAMLMLVARVDYLAAFKLVTLIVLCVAAVASWRFAAEVVSLRVATLLTIVLFLDAQFGSGFYSNRFGQYFYRAESFAVMLGFLALWLTYRGLMRREWGLLAFAPFALALAATGHGITAFVAATIIGSLFLAKWIVRRKIEKREAVALALIAGFSLAGTLLIFRAAGGAPLYQQSVTDTAAFQAYGNTDPTSALRAVLDGEANPEYVLIHPKATQRFYISPARLWDDLVRASFPDVFHASASLLLIVAFFAALAAVLTAPHTAQSYRIAGVAFVLVFAAAYLLGLAFSFLYETYSPAMHPSRRVFPYLSLAVLVWGAIILQRLLDLANVRARQRRVWRVLGAHALYAAAGLVMLLGFARPGVQTILNAASNTGISPDGSAALAWLKQHTAPDALVLINHRTAGAVEIMANRLSLTEGRGVYVRPDLLKRVFEILGQTAVFYQNPLYNTVLKEAGVDYVIVAPAHDIGGWMGYGPETEFTFALCEAAPFLTQVAQFGEVHIFEVDSSGLAEQANARLLEVREPEPEPADTAGTLPEMLASSAVEYSSPTVRVESVPFLEQLTARNVGWIALDPSRFPSIEASLERLPLAYPKALEAEGAAVYLVNRAEGSPLAGVSQAQLALARGDLAGACGHFQAARAGDPELALALAGVGLCQEANGDQPAARLTYEEALARLGDPSWTMQWPAELEPWRNERYLSGRTWPATIHQAAQDFLETRLAYLETASPADVPAARVWITDSLKAAGSGAAHWETVLVGGWPYAVLAQPADLSSSLALGLRPGDPFYALLAADGPDSAPFSVEVLAETPAGPRRLLSATLASGSELAIQGVVPAEGDGHLTLAGAGNTLNRLIWQSCRRPCPEQDTSANDAGQLADWLAQQWAERFPGRSPNLDAVEAYAGALLYRGQQPPSASLESWNLLTNSEFDGGSLAGWNAIPGPGSTTVRAQKLPGLQENWAAESYSDGAGYHGGLCQTVDVQAGQAYLYLVQAGADLPAGSLATVAYADRQRFGIVDNLAGVDLTGHTFWMPFWQLIVVPANTTRVSVCPALLSGPGSVRFDRAWFIPFDRLAEALR